MDAQKCKNCILKEIEQIRTSLNLLVDGEIARLLDKDVFKLSVELDYLIVQFMKIEQSEIHKGEAG